MANEEHVALLRKGVDAWNEWLRERRAAITTDGLFWADLEGADLHGANLRGANLHGTVLHGADLHGADLHGADLSFADLTRTNLAEADLTEANLTTSALIETNLSGVSVASLPQATRVSEILGDRAPRRAANLSGANLSGAKLIRANLTGTNLTGADLSGIILSGTVFGDTTLTDVKGLNDCHHQGPSIIDFQTLKNSGPLPIAFLRGVGLPDNLIEYLPSLLNEAIQFFSCFISYASKDELFAERLHADLQNKGVRCWFAPHDMPIGAKIIDALDEAIRLRDKVLLILSQGAIASDWVEGEVTRALDEERTRKQLVLFPVRIDDAVMQTSEAWARLLRGQRNIGDFTRWKEHDSYQKSFERLMRDLRVESEGER